MAVANGRASAPLIKRLFHDPYRFDFFQAVRVLDSHARSESEPARRWSVGHDAVPVQEIVRFRPPRLSTSPRRRLIPITRFRPT